MRENAVAGRRDDGVEDAAGRVEDAGRRGRGAWICVRVRDEGCAILTRVVGRHARLVVERRAARDGLVDLRVRLPRQEPTLLATDAHRDGKRRNVQRDTGRADDGSKLVGRRPCDVTRCVDVDVDDRIRRVDRGGPRGRREGKLGVGDERRFVERDAVRFERHRAADVELSVEFRRLVRASATSP